MLTLFRKDRNKTTEATAPALSPLKDAILARLDQMRRAGAGNPMVATGLTLAIPHLDRLTEADLKTMVDVLYQEVARLRAIAHADDHDTD